jgi:hypothetical protein
MTRTTANALQTMTEAIAALNDRIDAIALEVHQTHEIVVDERRIRLLREQNEANAHYMREMRDTDPAPNGRDEP